MYTIQFVRDDNLNYIETISKNKANTEYFELCNDPTVESITPMVCTIDIKFHSSDKVYTYFIDLTIEQVRNFAEARRKDPKAYAKAVIKDEIVEVITIKHRKTEDLKAKAKRFGFSFSDYKVLHGVLIK